MLGDVEFIYAASAFTVIRSGCLCHWRTFRERPGFHLIGFALNCPVHKGEN